MKLNSQTIFYKSPGKGQLACACSFYTHRDGVEKMAWLSLLTRSDTLDVCYRIFSADNGRTWSTPEEIRFITKTPQGTTAPVLLSRLSRPDKRSTGHPGPGRDPSQRRSP